MVGDSEWIRSTRCETGNCVEVTWLKSERSGADGCIEVASGAGHILMRDSKDPDGPVLVFTWREWRAFREGIGAISEALDMSLASSVPSER